MSVFWLQPAAWWGLVALAIPVVIHLVMRQQSRRLLFPSLKFLRATRLAALGRRKISDWTLLAVRTLILAAAVAAFAAPVFVSDDRRQSWNARVARAVVVAPPPANRGTAINEQVTRLVTDERASAFVSAAFHPSETVGDGLSDAVAWLQRQLPASREVVVVGDLRHGSVIGRDFAVVPRIIGIRLLPIVPTEAERRAQLRAIADSTGETMVHDLQLLLDDDRTGVTDRPRAEVTGEIPIEVRASPEDQPRAEAALRAVLGEGIVLHRDPERRVEIEFAGALSLDRRTLLQPAERAWMRRALEQMPEVRGGEADGRLIVRAGFGGGDRRALQLVARVARTVFADDLRDLEPRPIPASTLASWSRPAASIPDERQPGDEGDRRYLWMVTLALLALEHWLRRSRRAPQPREAAEDGVEARVA